MDPEVPPHGPDDSLAAHAGFLRSLARGLLFDRAAADDVAQKALLTALQDRRRGRDSDATNAAGTGGASGSSGFSLRGWLAGVVRNLARERGREEQRRSAREQRAARPEAVPSAADTVARLELMQRVVGAVRGLEEPYRTTVLLRFFDGMKPAAIARRMDVPVETVRTRLKRGLERLRLELDARHGGDRVAWGVALLPTALPASGAVLGGVVSSATFHALVVGGMEAVAMSTNLKIAMGAATAALTAAVIWTAVNNAPEPAHADARAAAPIVATPDVAKAGASRSAEADSPPAESKPATTEATRESTSTPLDPSLTFVVRGRCHLVDGRARPGVHVKVSRFDGYETTSKPAATLELQSDANGELAWPQRPPSGTATFLAEGLDDDYVALRVTMLVLSGDPPTAFDLAIYPYDTQIVGRVTDEHDEPIAEATVSSWSAPKPATTDEHGEYVLAASSSYGQAMLSAWAPGHAEGRATATLGGPGGNCEVNFRLRPACTVLGRVTDEQGAPIAGARVRSSSSWGANSVTGTDGRYRLDSIDPVRPQDWLQIDCAGYVSTGVPITVSAGEIEKDVVLKRGARVEGVVLDVDGKAVRGAEVWIGEGRFYADMQRGLSHDDGSFAFEHVATGPRKVGCEKKGHPPVELPITVPADPDRLDGIQLRFGAAHFLAGKVVDRDGNAVAGAHVMYCRDPSSYDGYAVSGADGAFRLEAMGAGPYLLRVSRSGFLMSEHPSGALDREDALLTLERAGAIAGRVVDGDTGEVVRKFKVRFVDAKLEKGEQGGWGWESTWSEPGRSFVTADGVWRCDGESLPIGAVIGIEVTAAGYAPAIDPHVVVRAGVDPDQCVLRLTHGAVVTGVVLDERSQPLEGVLVRLVAGKGDSNPWHAQNDDARWTARTGANGAFQIEAAPAGDCHLELDCDGFAPKQDGPFEVPSHGAAPARTIHLERGGVIDGVVLDAAGEPQASRRVSLYVMDDVGTGRQPLETTTDAAGRFRFDGLPHGVQQVSVQRQLGPQIVNELNVRVRIDGPDPVSVRVQPTGSASLHGRITGDAAANEPCNVYLHWMGPPESEEGVAQPDTGPSLDRGTFSSDGRFDFDHLEPGRYDVSVTHWGQLSNTSLFGNQKIRIDAGASVEVTVGIAGVK